MADLMDVNADNSPVATPLEQVFLWDSIIKHNIAGITTIIILNNLTYPARLDGNSPSWKEQAYVYNLKTKDSGHFKKQ